MKQIIKIENNEKGLLASSILEELSVMIQKNTGIEELYLEKAIVSDTKGEINLFLQILIDVGVSITASLIYDYIKMIVKSKLNLFKKYTEDQAAKLNVHLNNEIKTITIDCDSSSNEINITIE